MDHLNKAERCTFIGLHVNLTRGRLWWCQDMKRVVWNLLHIYAGYVGCMHCIAGIVGICMLFCFQQNTMYTIIIGTLLAQYCRFLTEVHYSSSTSKTCEIRGHQFVFGS